MNATKPLLLCLLLRDILYTKEIKENSGNTLTDYQVLLDLSGTNFKKI